MVQIVATPEQAKLLGEHPSDLVEIVDAQGNRLGFLARPFTQPDYETARRRAQSTVPRHTTQQVLERLQALEPR